MIPLLILSAMVVIMLALAAQIYRRPAFGAGLLVTAFLVEAVTIKPLSFAAVGLNIQINDMLALVLAVVTAARLVFEKSSWQRLLAPLPFVTASAAAFVLGAAWYGLKTAGVEYRSFFWLGASILYCASFPPASRQLKRLAVIWIAGAIVLLGIAWFRWSVELLELGIASQWAKVGGGNRLRVLNASQALYLAQALLMVLYFCRHARAPGMLASLGAALGVTVLLLQHRSVWIITLLACLFTAWHERALRLWVRRAAVAGLILLLGFALLPEPLAYESEWARSLTASVVEPFDPAKSTMAWRLGVWSEYLLEYISLPPWQMLVGTGLGNPAVYSVGRAEVDASAHNYFIFLLNRAGLLGLLGLVIAYGILVHRLSGTGGRWDYAGMLLALTLTQLVFFTVYSPSYEQGLLAGAASGIPSLRGGRYAR